LTVSVMAPTLIAIVERDVQAALMTMGAA